MLLEKQIQWAFIPEMYHFLDSFQMECVLNKSERWNYPILKPASLFFGFRASKFGGCVNLVNGRFRNASTRVGLQGLRMNGDQLVLARDQRSVCLMWFTIMRESLCENCHGTNMHIHTQYEICSSWSSWYIMAIVVDRNIKISIIRKTARKPHFASSVGQCVMTQIPFYFWLQGEGQCLQ